jgi:hypothetical protein
MAGDGIIVLIAVVALAIVLVVRVIKANEVSADPPAASRARGAA